MAFRLKLRRHRRHTPIPGRVSRDRNILPKLLILVAAILIIVFILGDHGVYRLYSMKREKKRLLEEINQLREEQHELLAEKDRLENDLEYIERLARERHRMAKAGEKVFKVLEKPEP
ncbi:MAG TPA: septum formation initiator family protein [Candidatus Marinimicrobia bacterium]|nr:septum formation initiator family protein [Candidatus Neomarinimicrobiota bacterium]